MIRDVVTKRMTLEQDWRNRKGKFRDLEEEDFFKFLDDDEKVKNEVLKDRAKGSITNDHIWKRFEGCMEILNGKKFKGSVDEHENE